MRRCAMRKALLAVAAVLLLVSTGPADDAVKKDLQKLEGTWQLVSQVADGKEMPAEDAKKVTVTIDPDGRWQVMKEGKLVLLGTVKLDPAKDPKAADWTVTAEGKEQVARGIYEVDADTFKHCYSQGDRPTKFESKEGSKVTYAVFKRAKK
jgi:uncharacterized protein (TIGR03067 family)